MGLRKMGAAARSSYRWTISTKISILKSTSRRAPLLLLSICPQAS
jgi:hypothetical protein